MLHVGTAHASEVTIQRSLFFVLLSVSTACDLKVSNSRKSEQLRIRGPQVGLFENKVPPSLMFYQNFP